MKPKQRRILLLVALLLVVIAIFTGRWLLESTPEITEVSHVAPEHEAAESETTLEQPRPPEAEVTSEAHEPSKDESPPPPTGKALEPFQSKAPAPSLGISKADSIASPSDKAVVTYGVQVFVAATVDEDKRSINGESEDRSRSRPLAIERNLFVSDEAIVGRELEPDAVVRGYIACGINASWSWGSDENGNILECRADRPEFVSQLLGLRARKGPNASIVVVGVEPEQEKSGALWDLGLSTFLPRVPVVSGAKWIVPAGSFAHVVSPGSDLLLTRAPDGHEELVAITPGGAPTHAQLGTWTGDSIATYEGTTMVGSRERHSARIAIDVTCKSEDSSLGQLYLDLLFSNPDLKKTRLKSRGTAKLESTFTGSGIVTWYDGDTRPPVSEIRCTFSVTVELHLDLATKIDCVYRAHGQLAYLAGQSVRDDDYWSQMWQPRDVFLARDSLTIR